MDDVTGAGDANGVQDYFRRIDARLAECYAIAAQARAKGHDPENHVDIRLANNMAERVEGLISVAAPQLAGSGMTPRIQDLEKEYSPLDWRVGFRIAEEVAMEKFCTFKDRREAMEVGIRVGFSYLTSGIVSAPLEGFIGLKIKQTKDGKDYFSVCYAGPIRGAGGTAAALSVILSDYIRVRMGYSCYDPQPEEISRCVTEIMDYHERAVNLQYLPSEEELRFLLAKLPVEINGDPTEKFDVSNYKDLARIETNRIRGGICLVIAEGLCQKAAKLWKRIGVWGVEFGLDWQFLEEFLRLQKRIKSRKVAAESKQKISPNYTFVSDLVAGRPVLTQPMAHGGFRLRYGRSRLSGFSAASIHPATMALLEKYIAIGTQLKVERPGKAASITPCDSILGPVVRLKDGSVVSVQSFPVAKEIIEGTEEIIYLGDILFNYGDFSENGHLLVPCGYCEEWWQLELEKACLAKFGTAGQQKLASLLQCHASQIAGIFTGHPGAGSIEFPIAAALSKELRIPLHPAFTFWWNALSPEQCISVIHALLGAKILTGEHGIEKIVVPFNAGVKRCIELLAVPHLFVSQEYIVIEKEIAQALALQVNLLNLDKMFHEKLPSFSAALELINHISPVVLRDMQGTFIGARMGRPEKAKMRELKGSPQVLFPVGPEGGKMRSFNAALEAGKVTADFPSYECKKCSRDTIYPVCESCRQPTFPDAAGQGSSSRSIAIKHYFDAALQTLEFSTYPDIIKGVKGTSNKDHTPERLEKGILRAKHGIYVNKDGTTRYDISEVPCTHFKPKEVGTAVHVLKELGYKIDIHGKDLTDAEQTVELFPQDIILPGCRESPDEAADVLLMRVAQFVDEMLAKLYRLPAFYNISSLENLAGQLVIGLAPHISAGIVGRIIGFSQTQGCFAHPMWHAALRRDCDGDECCIILLMDGLINFSRKYLPDRRGGRTMDSPLVLTSRLIPSEIDDQAHGLDTVWRYPLEFYEAALSYAYPWEVFIEQIKNRLNTPRQYCGMGFTHDVSNLNTGVRCSAYKSLPTMEEKLHGQMRIAEKIRAVNAVDVAAMVIEKHFLKDTKGNLRKFSTQQFRCVHCNAKFRRPPLVGKCTSCGGRIIFTISEGSVTKYLKPSLSLAKKYQVSAYLQQTLELLTNMVEDVFGKQTEEQKGLGDWFG